MSGPRMGEPGPGGIPQINTPQVSYAALQQDFPYQDNVDATHPLNLDYFMAFNCQRVVTARLSFKLRTYRTYSNFSVTATGAGSSHVHANAGGETGHSHSHNHAGHTHNISIGSGDGGNGLFWASGSNPQMAQAGASTGTDNTSIQSTTPTTDASGSSGHSHTGNVGAEAAHTHTVSGSSFLGISDGPLAAGVTLLFDGVDHTADLGGPFSTDQVELDVTKYISTKVDKAWHLIALTPSGQGRIQAILRVLYVTNQF